MLLPTDTRGGRVASDLLNPFLCILFDTKGMIMYLIAKFTFLPKIVNTFSCEERLTKHLQ